MVGMPFRSRYFSDGLPFMIFSMEYSVSNSHLQISRCSKTLEVYVNFNKGWSVILLSPLSLRIRSLGKPISSFYLVSSFLISPFGRAAIPSSPIFEQPVRSNSYNSNAIASGIQKAPVTVSWSIKPASRILRFGLQAITMSIRPAFEALISPFMNNFLIGRDLLLKNYNPSSLICFAKEISKKLRLLNSLKWSQIISVIACGIFES